MAEKLKIALNSFVQKKSLMNTNVKSVKEKERQPEKRNYQKYPKYSLFKSKNLIK